LSGTFQSSPITPSRSPLSFSVSSDIEHTVLTDERNSAAQSQWKHHGYNRRTEARWLRQWRDPPFSGESPIQKDVPYRAAFNQAVTKGDSPVRPPRARPIWDGQLKKREVKLRPACELDGPMMHPIATAYSPSGEDVGYVADAYIGVGDSWV
jgi:hypothetical protein